MGHHTGIAAAAQGMAVIDAGHFGLEQLFMDFMAEYLSQAFQGEIEVLKASQGLPNCVI